MYVSQFKITKALRCCISFGWEQLQHFKICEAKQCQTRLHKTLLFRRWYWNGELGLTGNLLWMENMESHPIPTPSFAEDYNSWFATYSSSTIHSVIQKQHKVREMFFNLPSYYHYHAIYKINIQLQYLTLKIWLEYEEKQTNLIWESNKPYHWQNENMSRNKCLFIYLII